METSLQPIGIFDSGIGGLTVAKAVAQAMPGESILYFGDRARCPYGDRSSDEVIRFSLEIGEFLAEQGVKCIVVACNTATAVALPVLRETLSIPVVGVIDPGAQAAVQATRSGRIGVIGTTVTIASHAYRTSICAIAPDIDVIETSCPAFVPLVEAGHFDGEDVERVVGESLRTFEADGIDTLVLGCTHYPLLANVIRRIVGPSVNVISSATATASYVSKLLREGGLSSRRNAPAAHRYLTSGDIFSMQMALTNWFGEEVTNESIRQVALPLSSEAVSTSGRI